MKALLFSLYKKIPNTALLEFLKQSFTISKLIGFKNFESHVFHVFLSKAKNSKVFLQSLLILILMIYSNITLCQDMAKDTFNISEVKITQTRTQLFSDANKKDEIDTSLIKFYANNDLSYLIKHSSLANISSYGSFGAVASAKMRGGGGVHTQVLWNGIPINSLTTGSADLSMINVGAFNQINVIYGASGSLYGSGTFGGAIELNNTPDFNNKKSLQVSADAGSFSNYRGRLSALFSNNKISYSGQVFYGYGKNDYKYRDILDFGSPEESAVNAENSEYATIHTLFVKLNKHTFKGGLWYQAKDHNVPGTMGIGNPVSYQNQKDSTLKTFIGWQYISDAFQINAQSAFIYDGELYTNKETADGDFTTYSQIASKRWLNLINSRYYFDSNLILSGQLKYNYLIGDVSSYGKMIYENEEDFSLAIKYTLKKFLINVSVSKNWNTLTSPPVMFAFSSLYQLIPDFLSLRAKVSSNYTRPTFNERYWQPGGNPDLKSEEGNYYELGVKTNLIHKDKQDLIIDANYYYGTNKNQIVWESNGGISTPVNIDNVLSRGIELDGLYKLHLSDFALSFHLAYSFCKTLYNDPDNSNYKENLSYHPKQIGRYNILANYKKWSFAINNSYQSNMYSTDGYKMDAIFLTDIQLIYDYNLKKINGQIKLSSNNIFNYSYQLVYSYPMPGRSLWFGFSINI